MSQFKVTVSDHGVVYEGSSKRDANRIYNKAVRASKTALPPTAGKAVVLLVDGVVKAEHRAVTQVYRVSVVDKTGSDSRTIYEGTSFLSSQKFVDAIRTALVIGGGTADIEQRLNEKISAPVIQVENGTWGLLWRGKCTLPQVIEPGEVKPA